MRDINALKGLVFVDPTTGQEFGFIRELLRAAQHPAKSETWSPFADDDCGNAFVEGLNGEVAFWDHETDEFTHLAASFEAFSAGCAAPEPVDLDPNRVVSSWIDPSLAEELGVEAGPDGWIKRPR